MFWTGFIGTFACISYTEEDYKKNIQCPQFCITDSKKEVLRFGWSGLSLEGETLKSSRRQLSQDICDCKVFKAIQEETAKDKAK